MRRHPISISIASTLLAGLALGCNSDPAYNTPAQLPPAGDPPITRTVATAKGKARTPRLPIARAFPRVGALGTTTIVE
jgi:hypothetical protein